MKMDQQNLLMLAVLLVVCSGLISATVGFFAKRSKHKSVFLGSMILVATIVLFPHLLMELAREKIPPAAYLLIMCSASLQAIGGALSSRMYVFGDLSQVYPIMRGTGVVIIPVIGVLLLGEKLSGWGWMGVASIAVGVFLLSGWNPLRGSRIGLRPVLFAISVGLCITCYTVVDKLTLHYLTPLSLLEVGNIGYLLVFVPQMIKPQLIREEWQLNWIFILLTAILSPGSYFLFLVAMRIAPVSHIAPIREIGTVFASLLGVTLLKERHAWKRIATSAIITTGIIIIGVSG
jgi:drug/metabolite transporter (DMT)-like permease